MTEKTILQQISNLVFDIQNTDDLQVIFDRADEILELTNQDHQPKFEVGEYYADGEFIYHILEDREGTNRLVNSFELATGIMHKNLVWTYKGLREPKPATAEQIAEFKRAEIKNDIDFIIKDGDGDWIEIVENIEDYFQTAEELREVEDNAD